MEASNDKASVKGREKRGREQGEKRKIHEINGYKRYIEK